MTEIGLEFFANGNEELNKDDIPLPNNNWVIADAQDAPHHQQIIQSTLREQFKNVKYSNNALNNRRNSIDAYLYGRNIFGLIEKRRIARFFPSNAPLTITWLKIK